MRHIVLDMFLENRCVLVVLHRGVSVGFYLITEVIIKRGFPIIGVAFINNVSIDGRGADHIVHPALIHKLIIICKHETVCYGLSVMKWECELHHLVAEPSMAYDKHKCIMFGLENIAVKY